MFSMYPKNKNKYISIPMEIYSEWRTLKFSLKIESSQRSKIKLGQEKTVQCIGKLKYIVNKTRNDTLSKF